MPSGLIHRKLPELSPAFNSGAYKLTLGIFEQPVRLSPRTGEQSLPATIEGFSKIAGVLAAAWHPNNTPDDYERTKAATAPRIRPTETAAAVTADIDIVGTKPAIELYRQCEEGLYGEGGIGSGVVSEQVLNAIEATREGVERGGVVVIGAGTSRRIAHRKDDAGEDSEP